MRLAGPPGVAQAFRPIRPGRQKLQVFEPVALGLSEAQALRLRERRARRARGKACLPKRCEDSIGLAVAGDDRLRLEQQATTEHAERSAGGLAGTCHRLFQFRLPGLIASADVDRRRASLGEQRRENLRSAALAQAKSPAAACKIGMQRGEAAVQPPARGAAHAEASWCCIVEDVERKNRCAALRCCGQRRMVGEPEIVAEPDDDWRGQIICPGQGLRQAPYRGERESPCRSSRTRRASAPARCAGRQERW